MCMNENMYSIKCKSIVDGYGKGYVLVSRVPINLLTIDANGMVNDSTHELNGRSIASRVLVFPNAMGSSVGAYRLYAAKLNGKAPSAVVCSRTDIITASACAISNIPLVECNEYYDKLVELCSSGGDDDMILEVDATNAIIIVKDSSRRSDCK